MQLQVEKILAAKPQLALEKFTIKTANGESQLNVVMGLAKPTSFEQPPVDVTKQMLTALDAKLLLSKPMIADLSAVQAQLVGQTDPQAIAKMASMNSEMAGVMAVQTWLAKVEGNNILASLNYADGQVDLNGQKMSLEDFINQMVTRFGGMASQMRAFIDTLGGVWAQGGLANKAVSAMTSAQNAHGGQESTLLTFYYTAMHWGSIIVAPGFTDPALFKTGGNPYGYSHTQGAAFTDEVKASIGHQTKRLIEMADKLTV